MDRLRLGGGMERAWLRRLLAVLRVILGVALLLYVLRTGGGWSSTGRFLSVPWLLPLVSLTPFVGAAVEALRLRVLFRSQGVSLPVAQAYRLVSVGTLFNFAIPGGTGGDVMKLYYLATDNRGKGVEVATVLLVDRGLAVFSLLLIVLLLAGVNLAFVMRYPVVQFLVGFAVAVLVIMVLALLLSWSERFRAGRLHQWSVRRAPLHRYWERASNALFRFRRRIGVLALAVGLSAIGHVMLVAVFAAVATSLIESASAGVASLLALIGMFANALPVTPGGLGVGEAAFDQLFAMAGLSGGALLILAWRVGMVPLSILGFLFYAAGVGRRSVPADAVMGGH